MKQPLQQLLYHFLVGEQALQVVGETPAEHIREEVALYHVGFLLLLDFLLQQFGEQFHSEIALLHVLHLLDESFVEERELYLAVAEEIDHQRGSDRGAAEDGAAIQEGRGRGQQLRTFA